MKMALFFRSALFKKKNRAISNLCLEKGSPLFRGGCSFYPNMIMKIKMAIPYKMETIFKRPLMLMIGKAIAYS